MEAQLVALNQEGDIVSTHVLDMPWKSVLLALIGKQRRNECANWSERRLEELVGRVELNPQTSSKIACQKVMESPAENKWSRLQKTSALEWLALEWNPEKNWENYCIDAKRKFKINPRDPSEEYNWFVSCLGLKQLLDFQLKWPDCTCIVAPIAPLNEE